MAVSRRQLLAIAASALATPAGWARSGLAKIDLWDNARGPFLRGATFAQRPVYPEIDGPEFLGPGPVGAPVTDAALAGLAAQGANLAILSVPGTFAERPPYALDPAIEAHLDDLVTRCERAGLFVVIGFRTGPGRSAFTFHRDDAGSWFPASMVDEHLWRSEDSGRAWEAMWRHTAAKYRGRSHVAGYLLMVEPNANQAAPGPSGGDLDEWDPQRLTMRVAGTPADWPRLARRLASAVRSVDYDTPILVSPDGYAHRSFEHLLDMDASPGQVLALHEYAPRGYTHQARGARLAFAPLEPFQPPAANRWMMGEFGVHRWAPDAAKFLAERIDQFEALGAAWALFRWDSGWRVYEDQENGFNPLYGADPQNAQFSETSPILQELRRAWARNTRRPSAQLRR
jgi:hypothetical protein